MVSRASSTHDALTVRFAAPAGEDRVQVFHEVSLLLASGLKQLQVHPRASLPRNERGDELELRTAWNLLEPSSKAALDGLNGFCICASSVRDQQLREIKPGDLFEGVLRTMPTHFIMCLLTGSSAKFEATPKERNAS
ncbi:hypothetical protein PM082_021489 [Marasmius tenuissimus]|nr:hypothetical protein PM082_021489 [Marasmius tenuissimus]